MSNGDPQNLCDLILREQLALLAELRSHALTDGNALAFIDAESARISREIGSGGRRDVMRREYARGLVEPFGAKAEA